MTKELTVKDFVPVGTYNLQDLVNFELLELPTAVRLSGQEVSTFDDNEKYQALAQRIMMDKTEQYGSRIVIRDTKTGRFKGKEDWRNRGLALATLLRTHKEHGPDYKLSEHVVDSNLATRLTSSGVQVPEDKMIVFGDGFSKIVTYNSALTKPTLTDADGASPEFREVLYDWHDNIHPSTNHSTRYYLKNARDGNSLHAIWAVGAYSGKKLSEGKTIDEIIRSDRLRRLLRQAAEARKADNAYYSERNHKELSLLAANAGLVFENYRRIHQFRDQFRTQINALVDLYSSPQWEEETQAYAQRMKQFLSE